MGTEELEPGKALAELAALEAATDELSETAGRLSDDDVRSSAERLHGTMRAMPAEAWEAGIRMLPEGPRVPAGRVPSRRLREVLIHHVDLAARYTPAHWPAAWVAGCLPEVAGDFARRDGVPAFTLRAEDTDRVIEVHGGGPTVTGPDAALLTWLLGRSAGDGLTVTPHGPLPELPAWS